MGNEAKRYRSRQEMIEYFVLLERDFAIKARRAEKIEDKMLFLGKSEAYHMAAFELINNLEPNG